MDDYSLHALSRGEHYAAQSAVQPSQQYGGAYSLGKLQNHPFPLPSLHGGEGSSFPSLVAPSDTVNSVVNIKPGDSGVVIRYEVDKFTHTWSVGHCVA